MEPKPRPQPNVQNWLLGLVAAGFLAWSFAVFKAITSVEILAERLINVEKDLDNHTAKPWHPEAGHLIRLQQSQMKRVEKLLHELKEDQ